jgi:outer membrane protein OmpA-like peptidoglycan-associated protein
VNRRLALGAALLLAGCARDSVLLLPNEDGRATGAVAVIDEKRGREVVVDRPLTQASLTGGGAQHSVKTLKKSYAELLGTLPPGATAFILNFPQGSTALTPESRPVLDSIRQEIARRPGAEVQVTGHTDTVDTQERNDRLSLDRAQAVVRLLIADGFPADILSAVGRGEREPLVPTADNVSNEANRRVEVIVR